MVTVLLQYIACYYVFYSVTVNVYSIFLITVFLPTVLLWWLPDHCGFHSNYPFAVFFD